MMRVGSGRHTYEWIDGWADVPDAKSASSGWAHHGVVVTHRNTVVVGHPARAELLEFDANGRLVSQARTELTECHGITLVTEEDTDYLWVVDIGRKHKREPTEPQVVKLGLDGKAVMKIERPPPTRSTKTGSISPLGRQRRHMGSRRIRLEPCPPLR